MPPVYSCFSGWDLSPENKYFPVELSKEPLKIALNENPTECGATCRKTFIGNARASSLVSLFICACHVRNGSKLGPRAVPELGPFIPGGLKRSTQHFILKGKDGV